MTTRIVLINEVARQRALFLIGNLNLDGKAWEIEVRRHKKKRSLSQNALLHKWLQIIAEETGNTMEDVKEAYRELFLCRVPIVLGDREKMVNRSTTNLTTQEFSDFCDKIHAHATQELGIILPLPDEQHYDREGHAA